MFMSFSASYLFVKKYFFVNISSGNLFEQFLKSYSQSRKQWLLKSLSVLKRFEELREHVAYKSVFNCI